MIDVRRGEPDLTLMSILIKIGIFLETHFILFYDVVCKVFCRDHSLDDRDVNELSSGKTSGCVNAGADLCQRHREQQQQQQQSPPAGSSGNSS